MMFNVYFPIIEFVGFWFMRFAFRLLDGGKENSKKSSIKLYCDTYMGPQYMIHYKYSSVLNICFVTFMYGYGIPILFPIAAVSFLTLYVVEKALIYYSYRQPPMYDNVLNDSVLSKLSWAPFLYLVFGYWMLTNPTLFGNNPVPVNRVNMRQLTDHVWSSALEEKNLDLSLSFPFFVMALFYLVVNVFKGSLWSIVTFVCPCWELGNIKLNEGLDNYFDALEEEDRNWLIKEEENCRNQLNFHTLTTESLQKLRGAKPGLKKIQGTPTYDILASPHYMEDFQYYSAAIENRGMFIEDGDDEEGNDFAQSDMVKIILNLAYL